MVCVKTRYHTYSMEKTISEILHGRTGWSISSSVFVWERGVIHFGANKVLHINYFHSIGYHYSRACTQFLNSGSQYRLKLEDQGFLCSHTWLDIFSVYVIQLTISSLMERMKALRRFSSSQKQYFLPGAGFLIRTEQLSSSAVFCNATTLS